MICSKSSKTERERESARESVIIGGVGDSAGEAPEPGTMLSRVARMDAELLPYVGVLIVTLLVLTAYNVSVVVGGGGAKNAESGGSAVVHLADLAHAKTASKLFGGGRMKMKGGDATRRDDIEQMSHELLQSLSMIVLSARKEDHAMLESVLKSQKEVVVRKLCGMDRRGDTLACPRKNASPFTVTCYMLVINRCIPTLPSFARKCLRDSPVDSEMFVDFSSPPSTYTHSESALCKSYWTDIHCNMTNEHIIGSALAIRCRHQPHSTPQEEIRRLRTDMDEMVHEMELMHARDTTHPEQRSFSTTNGAILKTRPLNIRTQNGGNGASRGISNSTAYANAEDGVLVVFTSNGNMYSNWQSRLLHHSFLEVKDKPGSLLKGIVRLLHRSADDELMTEIPTVRVDPKYPNCEAWCEFPVNDRPIAVQSFFKHSPEAARRYKYMLVIEPDYLFMKPITSEHLPPAGEANAFPYGYIAPNYNDETRNTTRRIMGDPTMTKKQIEAIPGTGPAPLLIETYLLDEQILPLWIDYTLKIEEDAAAKKLLGWVREMYAYSFAVAKLGIKHHIPHVLNGNMLMSQPPADHDPLKTSLIHYTWGTQLREGTSFNKNATPVWEFDKRLFTAGIPHRKLPLPPHEVPANKTHHYYIQDGKVATQPLLNYLTLMMTIINGAFDRFDPVKCGEGSKYGKSCATDYNPNCRWPYKCNGTQWVET